MKTKPTERHIRFRFPYFGLEVKDLISATAEVIGVKPEVRTIKEQSGLTSYLIITAPLESTQGVKVSQNSKEVLVTIPALCAYIDIAFASSMMQIVKLLHPEFNIICLDGDFELSIDGQESVFNHCLSNMKDIIEDDDNLYDLEGYATDYTFDGVDFKEMNPDIPREDMPHYALNIFARQQYAFEEIKHAPQVEIQPRTLINYYDEDGDCDDGGCEYITVVTPEELYVDLYYKDVALVIGEMYKIVECEEFFRVANDEIFVEMFNKGECLMRKMDETNWRRFCDACQGKMVRNLQTMN